jgi:excisionase family DNA binding protein
MICDPSPSSGDLLDADSFSQEEIGLPDVITADELASLLRVNRDTVYKAIADGQIPGVRKIGRTIRISRDAVIEWLRGKDHVPRSERSKLWA